MPVKTGLPLCPKIIAIAKPRRASWCFEELSDLAVYLNSSAHYTDFDGVCIVKNNTNHEKLLIGIRKYKFSFARRIVFTHACAANREELINLIKALLEKYKAGSPIRIIFALRGSSKKYIDKKELEGILSEYNIAHSRKSRLILDLEGLGDIVALTLGQEASCGFDCMLVAPLLAPI